MATPWVPRSEPRYLSELGLIYGFDPRRHSDFEESSRQDPVPPESANVLRRGVKSFHDIREASEQRNGRQSSPSPDPSYPSSPVSTASEVGHNTSILLSAATFSQELCENCSVLNVEDLAQPGGHKHSMLSELFESRKWCGLCDLMAINLGIMARKELVTDRYEIVVSICGTGYDVEGPESTHRGRPRSPLGNGYSRAHTINRNPSQLWVDVIDHPSWEAPEDDIENLFSTLEKPRTFIAPDGSKLRTVGSMSLSCLTEEHDPATEFGVRYVRGVGSDTFSSFEVAAGWLADCLAAETPPTLKDWEPRRYGLRTNTGGSKAIDPDNKAVSLSAQAPLRLIEILPDARGKAPSIKLIHTDGRHYQYAALSYCWGKPQPGDCRPWQTKQATLASHLKGIYEQHLPKTLQDAIFICMRLHISHLWVDSLCIIQDSPSDWAAEAAKMSGIYLGSLLAISLSSSVSVEAGCFNQVSRGILDSKKFHAGWVKIDNSVRDGRRSRLYITFSTQRSMLFKDEVEHGVLSRRAWALQEHIMPQRTLYITSRQLLWECRHCRLSEDNYPQVRLRPHCISPSD